ncbi:MAG: hypothetical protein H7296_09160 [Bacteroidia bacterium]|nr:hypothetical protein [Bacteroidia bacterium]
MENEDITKKLLELLREDLVFYSDMIKEVAMDMIKEGYTKYPVFIAHQHEVKVGEPILLIQDYARDFNINATTLEELVERKLVLPEREADFKANYKDPKVFICILLITVISAHFIYVPYKMKKELQ